MTYEEKITQEGKSNGGYIMRKDIVGQGIPSVILSRMEKAGTIERVAPGIYLLEGYLRDEFYEISSRYGTAAFSRETALYLQNLTNRQLEKIEVNFPPHFNASGLKGVRCHFPGKTVYELGQTVIETPFGHKVKSYDVERCICDLFYHDFADNEEKAFVFANIDKKNLDYDKMFLYAAKLRVLPQIKAIFEVLR